LICRLLWTLCSLFTGVYNVVVKLSVILMVQPQIFGVLGSLCYVQVSLPFFICIASHLGFVQCLYYGSKRSLRTCILIFVGFTIFSAGFRIGFIYAFKHLLAEGVPGAKAGLRLFGMVASVLGVMAMM
jgi:hypothetical protein